MSGGLCSNFNMRFSIKIESNSNANNNTGVVHHLNSEYYPIRHQQQQQQKPHQAASNGHLSQFQASIFASISSPHDFDSTRLIPYISDKLDDDSVRMTDEIDSEGDLADSGHLTNSQPQVSSKLNVSSSASVSKHRTLFFVRISLVILCFYFKRRGQ